jgi:hypothetical protein
LFGFGDRIFDLFKVGIEFHSPLVEIASSYRQEPHRVTMNVNSWVTRKDWCCCWSGKLRGWFVFIFFVCFDSTKLRWKLKFNSVTPGSLDGLYCWLKTEPNRHYCNFEANQIQITLHFQKYFH